jgi:hypothetical protein
MGKFTSKGNGVKLRDQEEAAARPLSGIGISTRKGKVAAAQATRVHSGSMYSSS